MALSNAFALIASGSPYLTSLLRDHEDWARKLTPDNVDDECASVLAETAGAATASSRTEAMRMLRQSKQKLALLVALCDLGGLWTLEQVTMALTRFADAAVQAVLAFLWREERAKGHFTTDASGCGYLVLAMGKMGAFELNYSSDIDLIVFYDPGRAPLRADLEPSMFFVKF